jgi:putative lipoprotein
MRPLSFAIAVTAALFIAPAHAQEGLAEVTWTLSELGGTPVAEGVTTTFLVSADGRASGNGGCNSYGGDVVLDGHKMLIENLFSTMMACEEPAMDQEAAFLAAVEGTRAYHVSGDTLFLLDDAGNKLATLTSTE